MTNTSPVPADALVVGESPTVVELTTHPSVVALQDSYGPAIRSVARDAVGYPDVWIAPEMIAPV